MAQYWYRIDEFLFRNTIILLETREKKVVPYVQLNFNDFFHNTASEGGAMYLQGGRTFVGGSSFVENEATYGGAIYVAPIAVEGNTRRLYVVQSTFASNTATFKGASIHIPVNTNDLVYDERLSSGCDNDDPVDCNGAFQDGTCNAFSKVCTSPTASPTPRKL